MGHRCHGPLCGLHGNRRRERLSRPTALSLSCPPEGPLQRRRGLASSGQWWAAGGRAEGGPDKAIIDHANHRLHTVVVSERETSVGLYHWNALLRNPNCPQCRAATVQPEDRPQRCRANLSQCTGVPHAQHGVACDGREERVRAYRHSKMRHAASQLQRRQ